MLFAQWFASIADYLAVTGLAVAKRVRHRVTIVLTLRSIRPKVTYWSQHLDIEALARAIHQRHDSAGAYPDLSAWYL